MLNWQQIELQKKFGKKQEKQSNRGITLIVKVVLIFLLIVFFSLFFLNKDSQDFSSAAAYSESWLSEKDKWVK